MKITLDSLCADFEQHCREMWLLAGCQTVDIERHIDKCHFARTIDMAATREKDEVYDPDMRHVVSAYEAMRHAAVLYVIARDHGLEAAMLYKLSDGAIDPRKAVGK